MRNSGQERLPEWLSAASYKPLSDVLFADRFGSGLSGWGLLTGNYEYSLDNIIPEQADFRPPMLSNLVMWDVGSVGALTSDWALKLATKPKASSFSVALKRTTWRRLTRIRIETHFAFKPEASELALQKTSLGAFGVFLDLQDDDRRVMPHLRYTNSRDDRLVERWEYRPRPPSAHQLGETTRSHFHLGNDDWQPIPDGGQQLCYNELPTKHNWHYLRLDFDLSTMRMVELQCGDAIYKLESLTPMAMTSWPNLRGMLNVAFWSESTSDVRSILYLDSVVLSAAGVAP